MTGLEKFLIKATKASEGDWDTLASDKITKEEFPEGVLDWLDFEVIKVLALLRAKTAVPLMPSPVAGAHVRQVGTSQHSTKGGTRLSQGTDFFVRWKHAAHVLETARSIPEIGGLGFYTDMIYRGKENTYAMFHIDLRKDRIEWLGWREDRNAPTRYVYLGRYPKQYHKLLNDRARW